eukprot:TRINITY_DN4202_c1_g1_i1.p1 TRINITY_DN4202_c1_g1~~TRINITY_DN4202_c1_g1_i1.p1  ORF type:complete len:193 (+),score=42.63 TRINITY_DN4202_c1_g1_i1:155-733(+)
MAAFQQQPTGISQHSVREKIMKLKVMRVAVAFACGSFGGLCIGVFVPLASSLGLTEALGVAIHPQLSKQFVYSKVVWGGIWGPIMLLPLSAKSAVIKGALLGTLGPALVQLFIVFPLKETPGSIGGLTLGILTPALVVFFNAFVWGVPTSVLFHTLTDHLHHSTPTAAVSPSPSFSPSCLLDSTEDLVGKKS